MCIRILLTATLSLLAAGYSLAADTWTDMPNMKKPRAEASAVMYQDELYVFNGFAPRIDIESSVEKFNLATSQWTVLGSTSANVGNAVTHNGIVLAGQDVWLIGGRVGDHPGRVSDQVWIYTIGTGQWRQGPVLPVPSGGGGAALVNNKIHWFGGFDAKAQCDVNHHFTLDLSNQNAGWQDITASAAMPVPRNHFGTAVLDNKIYAIGGQFGHDGCPGKRAQDTSVTHRFDPTTSQWTQLADLPAAQSHTEPSTFAHGGYIYVVGGQIRGDKVLRYKPGKNSWTQTHTLPQRLLAPVARIIDGKLVVAGGGAPTTQVPIVKVRSIVLDAETSSPVETSPPPQALITVEAEDFDLITGTTTHEWISTALPGASQSGAMVTTPDQGTLRAGSNGSPVLSYAINFEHAGLYYLWIRGWGDTNSRGEGKNDSLHAGLNGVIAGTADKIDGFPPGWHWSQSTRDRHPATLTVKSPGLHTVDLWMREDGLAIDRFLLTSDPSYIPKDFGPAVDNTTPVVNSTPQINAGANATITLGESLRLDGQVSDDGLPTGSLVTRWKMLSGAGIATFTNENLLKTTVSFSVAGHYQLQLKADDGDLSSQDALEVIVIEPETQSGNTDAPNKNLIIIEAENYDSISGTDTHNWVASNLPDTSNGGAMITAPDIGVLRHGSGNSPMLSYLVNFDQAGKHYLWIRGWGDTNSRGEGKSDSLHAGLNGVLASSADKIDQFAQGWHWSQSTRDRAVATLNIPSAGLHAVNLWMREDGLAVDKLIISNDADYLPKHDASANSNPDDGNLSSDVTNAAPTANAGPDLTIQLGTVLSLNGMVSDDGLPNANLSASWQKKSGNGEAIFTDNSQASTTVTFSHPGFYVLRLIANDGQLSDSDLAGIRVLDASIQESEIDAYTAWTSVQTFNGSTVSARHEAGAVAVNGKIYVMGGRGNKPVESFDPATRKWTSHGRAPVDIHHFQPVSLNDKIYVIGALKNGGYPTEAALENIYIYNVTTHKWTKGPAIPTNRRRGSTGAAVYNNKIYIVGGNLRGHDGPSVNWLDEFNPATNQWKAMANAPHARDHATVAVADGKLIVAAGRRSAQPNVFANTESATDVYDFNKQKWESANSIPTSRAGTMTVSVGSEVVVIGGESLSSGTAHRQVESFNVVTGLWRALQPLSVGRHSGGAAVLGNQIHVVSGNETRGGGRESTEHETLALPGDGR